MTLSEPGLQNTATAKQSAQLWTSSVSKGWEWTASPVLAPTSEPTFSEMSEGNTGSSQTRESQR